MPRDDLGDGAVRSTGSGPLLLWGMGATNLAVATAVLRRGGEIVAVDDNPSEATRSSAEALGIPLRSPPGGGDLAQLMRGCSAFVPTPGLPDRHRALQAAALAGAAVTSEFDLAADWDSRPVVAITGTNGKTTVTTLVAAALAPSTAAVAAGNNELPLVSAIDASEPSMFVVEASSFRLGRSRCFRPRVAAWLNFTPDHLDVHASLSVYEEAKAAVWRHHGPDEVAVVNVADPVVERRRPKGGRVLTFGAARSDLAVRGGVLWACGEPLLEIGEMPRRFPHDLRNAEAVAACALAAGAPPQDVRDVLATFRGLPHRLELVARTATGCWYNDSKSTTPAATVAAAGAFDSVILIAGGRNKGLDLARLADAAPSVRAVVAIGECAGEVRTVFSGLRPVRIAGDMVAAVAMAGEMADPGDAVVLSPGCASFDWYGSYVQRGEDFTAAVHAALGQGRHP